MSDKDNPNFVERFTIRMPDGMRDAIADRAKANGRSMNSEIIQILQDALDGTGSPPTLTNETLQSVMGKFVSWYSEHKDAINRLSDLNDEDAEKIARDMKKKKPE